MSGYTTGGGEEMLNVYQRYRRTELTRNIIIIFRHIPVRRRISSAWSFRVGNALRLGVRFPRFGTRGYRPVRLVYAVLQHPRTLRLNVFRGSSLRHVGARKKRLHTFTVQKRYDYRSCRSRVRVDNACSCCLNVLFVKTRSRDLCFAFV